MSQTPEGSWPVFSSVGGILPIAWTKLSKDFCVKLCLRFLSEVEYLILQVSGCRWSKLTDLSTGLKDGRGATVVHSLVSAAKILHTSPDKSWLISYKTDSWISTPLCNSEDINPQQALLPYTHPVCYWAANRGRKYIDFETVFSSIISSQEPKSHLGCPLSCVMVAGREGREHPLWGCRCG